MIVDIYTHIFPERFFQELERGSPKLGNMGKRLRSVRKLFDLDLRFKDMDAVGDGYRQIISLPNPPIEDIAEGAVANNLAKVANVEIMTHPRNVEEFDYLAGPQFQDVLRTVPMGTYAKLFPARFRQLEQPLMLGTLLASLYEWAPLYEWALQ